MKIPAAQPHNLAKSTWQRDWLLVLIVGTVALLVAVLLQHRIGAQGNDFHTDEAAHYVTSLMVKDLVAGITRGNLKEQAETFYLHYPKVGLGHWPPMLYAVAAVAMATGGEGRGTVLLLMAGFTAAAAAGLFAALRRIIGGPVAAWVALATTVLFTSQEAFGRLMPDMLVNALLLLTAVMYSRFMRRPTLWYGLALGAAACAALMTRGTAFALAGLPLLTWLFARQWPAWNLKAWLMAVAPAVLVALPWYALTRGMTQGSWLADSSSAAYAVKSLTTYGNGTIAEMGLPLVLLSIVGAVMALRVPNGTTERVLWSALLAMAASVVLLHLAIPAGIEQRYIWLPMVVMLACAGKAMHRIISLLPNSWYPAISNGALKNVVWLLLGGVTLWGLAQHEPAHLRLRGFSALHQSLLSLDNSPSVLLVASDPRGEGSMVAYTAQADKRPGRFVLRGSKILIKEDWFGRDSVDLFPDTVQLAAALDRHQVGAVVVDTSLPKEERRPYHERLLQLLRQDSGWRLSLQQPVIRNGVPAGSAYLFVRQASDQPARPDAAMLKLLRAEMLAR